MSSEHTDVFDVAVIGAGVVGCAVARELSRYQLRCVLIEATNDIGKGTSKANTAILHTGFDGKVGFLETRLLRRGYERLKAYCAETGIPVEPLGALLVAWNEEQLQTLPRIREVAHTNGVTDVDFISVDDLYQREPHLGQNALGALEIPGESIICPFTTPLAYATQAVVNGVTFRYSSPVQSVSATADANYALETSSGTIRTQFVVNAAGLYSDVINRMFGYDEFTVTPRRGELIVFDKFSRSLVNHILLPVPGNITKGVLVSPTVFGNVMLGPNAEDISDRTGTQTTEVGLASLLKEGEHIVPELLNEEVTTTYAGLRAATEHSDYQIYMHNDESYLCLGGIRSTGLSASMGIAEYAAELLAEAGLSLKLKSDFKSVKMPNIGEAFMRPYQSHDMIIANPDYGQIVCHCESVTRGEIQDATSAVLPARDVDGLRRRTRAMFGRCQGFYCAAELTQLLAEGTGQHVEELTGLGSNASSES